MPFYNSFGANAGRNSVRLGGRAIGAVAGTLLGQPQLGYQLGGLAGDAIAPEAATRMKEFSNYKAPNPFNAYRKDDFTSETRTEERVTLDDPMEQIYPLADAAVGITGALGGFDKLGEAGKTFGSNLFGKKPEGLGAKVGSALNPENTKSLQDKLGNLNGLFNKSYNTFKEGENYLGGAQGYSEEDLLRIKNAKENQNTGLLNDPTYLNNNY